MHVPCLDKDLFRPIRGGGSGGTAYVCSELLEVDLCGDGGRLEPRVHAKARESAELLRMDALSVIGLREERAIVGLGTVTGEGTQGRVGLLLMEVHGELIFLFTARFRA